MERVRDASGGRVCILLHSERISSSSRASFFFRLVFCSHFLTSQFLHCFFSPDGITGQQCTPYAKQIQRSQQNAAWKERTHISPKATMQIVCHTPSPILGATPRYRPLMPFCPYIYRNVFPTVKFFGRFGSSVLLCISTRMTSMG